MEAFIGTSVPLDHLFLQELQRTETTFENTTATEWPAIERCSEYYQCPSTNTHSAIHFVAALLFGVLGCSFNCITIHLYSKKATNYANRFYILMLTYIDMGALIINLPQFILMKFIPCCVLRWTSFWPYTVMHVSYSIILNTMALERLVAVVSPFQFERKRKMIRYILITISLLWLAYVCLTNIFNVAMHMYRLVALVYPIICVMLLALIYLIIIFKLLQLSNKSVKKIYPRVTNPNRYDIMYHSL